jgi:hypothetical protein
MLIPGQAPQVVWQQPKGENRRCLIFAQAALGAHPLAHFIGNWGAIGNEIFIYYGSNWAQHFSAEIRWKIHLQAVVCNALGSSNLRQLTGS